MAICVIVDSSGNLKQSVEPSCAYKIATVEDNLLVTYSDTDLVELGGLLSGIIVTAYIGRILIRAISGNA